MRAVRAVQAVRAGRAVREARAVRAGRAARAVRAGQAGQAGRAGHAVRAGQAVRAGLGAVAVLGVLAAAPPPRAAEAWTATPAAGRPYVYLEGAPGSVLQDTLSVTNRTSGPLTVRLTAQGAPVAFAARTVTVPARTRADVPFAVTVAADTPPGERRGAVRAEAAGRAAVVPLHLRVSGPCLAALTVEDVTVDRSRGIRYTLVNRGNTVLAPRLAVHADGVLGTVLDRPERPLPLVLRPGERATRTEPWPDPPALDSVTVRLTAGAPDAAPATARADASFASPAGLGGAAAVLLAAAGAATTYAIRRRRR
ncbi:COG1470 family protein [Streptomyces sp. NPDC004788]